MSVTWRQNVSERVMYLRAGAYRTIFLHFPCIFLSISTFYTRFLSLSSAPNWMWARRYTCNFYHNFETTTELINCIWRLVLVFITLRNNALKPIRPFSTWTLCSGFLLIYVQNNTISKTKTKFKILLICDLREDLISCACRSKCCCYTDFTMCSFN